MKTRAEIEAELLAWMGEPFAPDEDRFDTLARALFRVQLATNEPYARFCAGRGVGPGGVGHWTEIPPVPTGAFKEVPLRCFDANDVCHVFRTSGTATAKRGELLLDTLALYEASLLPTFERFVLPGLRSEERARLLVLAPSPPEAPDSSLSHMFGVVLERRGDDASGFFVREAELALDALLASLERACSDRAPVVLCGTAFAFVHLLDALDARGARFPLPDGSRAMETGGFKGRARDRPRDSLYGDLERVLGLAPARIVNQYGMTELASQFYDSVLAMPEEPRRKLGPPWARVRLLDPETGEAARAGEPGIVTIVDLANTGSVLAVQTADLGREVGDGFEILGREAGAEERGCSIAVDAMLAEGP